VPASLFSFPNYGKTLDTMKIELCISAVQGAETGYGFGKQVLFCSSRCRDWLWIWIAGA
jgi:hypothetical protein